MITKKDNIKIPRATYEDFMTKCRLAFNCNIQRITDDIIAVPSEIYFDEKFYMYKRDILTFFGAKYLAFYHTHTDKYFFHVDKADADSISALVWRNTYMVPISNIDKLKWDGCILTDTEPTLAAGSFSNELIAVNPITQYSLNKYHEKFINMKDEVFVEFTCDYTHYHIVQDNNGTLLNEKVIIPHTPIPLSSSKTKYYTRFSEFYMRYAYMYKLETEPDGSNQFDFIRDELHHYSGIDLYEGIPDSYFRDNSLKSIVDIHNNEDSSIIYGKRKEISYRGGDEE